MLHADRVRIILQLPLLRYTFQFLSVYYHYFTGFYLRSVRVSLNQQNPQDAEGGYRQTPPCTVQGTVESPKRGGSKNQSCKNGLSLKLCNCNLRLTIERYPRAQVCFKTGCTWSKKKIISFLSLVAGQSTNLYPASGDTVDDLFYKPNNNMFIIGEQVFLYIQIHRIMLRNTKQKSKCRKKPLHRCMTLIYAIIQL